MYGSEYVTERGESKTECMWTQCFEDDIWGANSQNKGRMRKDIQQRDL